jgi:hypothetical protein
MTDINSVQVCENSAFIAASPRLTPGDMFDAYLNGTVFRWLKLYQEAFCIYCFKINGGCRNASREIWKKGTKLNPSKFDVVLTVHRR